VAPEEEVVDEADHVVLVFLIFIFKLLKQLNLRPRLQCERFLALDNLDRALLVRRIIERPDDLAETSLAYFFDYGVSVALAEGLLVFYNVIVVLVVIFVVCCKRRWRLCWCW